MQNAFFPESSRLKRTELFILSLNTFCLTFIAIKFALMHYGAAYHVNVIGAVLAASVATMFWFSLGQSFADGEKNRSKALAGTALIVILAIFYIFSLYHLGATLPANDPVADPTFASIIAKGFPLNVYYPAGQSGHAYPPGVPILLSVSYGAFGAINTLIIFKALCLLAVAVMPLTWAWATKEIFDLRAPLLTIAALSYVAAFGFERTLNYALPFAGKNSQLILLALFPIFLIQLKRSLTRSYIQLFITSITLVGLIFIHYSAIYLLFSLTAPLFLIRVWRVRPTRKLLATFFFRLALVGILGTGLFLLMFAQALHDPRSTLGESMNFMTALHTFVYTFISMNTSALTIFNLPSFQKIGSPSRGFALFSAWLVCWSTCRIAQTLKAKKAAQSILDACSCFVLATVIAVMFGSGLINIGASLDFARWFIFPAQFSIFLCALLSGLIIIENAKSKTGATVLFLSFLVMPIITFCSDTFTISAAAGVGVLSKGELTEMEKIFLPGSNGCYVIAPSTDAYGGLSYAQKYRPLEYLEAVTPCIIVNGSWVHGAYANWRTANGLPARDAFASAPSNVAIYFVGTEAELELFNSISKWERESNFPGSGVDVWKRFK